MEPTTESSDAQMASRMADFLQYKDVERQYKVLIAALAQTLEPSIKRGRLPEQVLERSDGRMRAAADDAAWVYSSPSRLERITTAIDLVIDWIAQQVWQERIYGIPQVDVWPTKTKVLHLAQKSHLTVKQMESVITEMCLWTGQGNALPLVGVLESDHEWNPHWNPDIAKLTAWSKGSNWKIINEKKESLRKDALRRIEKKRLKNSRARRLVASFLIFSYPMRS